MPGGSHKAESWVSANIVRLVPLPSSASRKGARVNGEKAQARLPVEDRTRFPEHVDGCPLPAFYAI